MTSPQLVVLTMVLAAGIFALDLLEPLGVAIGVLYTGVLLLSLWSSYRMFPHIVATGASILIVLGFFLSPPGSVQWMGLTNRALSLFTLWATVLLLMLHRRSENQRERLNHELQGAHDQITTLRGLLPICASCKKIRNDQGYWAHLETYIEAHSEATFTHGICPECQKKFYPQLEQNDKEIRPAQRR